MNINVHSTINILKLENPTWCLTSAKLEFNANIQNTKKVVLKAAERCLNNVTKVASYEIFRVSYNISSVSLDCH